MFPGQIFLLWYKGNSGREMAVSRLGHALLCILAILNFRKVKCDIHHAMGDL